jgi:predicted kinase
MSFAVSPRAMQLIVFTGLQASGKSTFYARWFFDTHLRLNLDQLNGSRHREWLLFEAALAAKTPTVIDNTNATAADRARYVGPARRARFEVVGYAFHATLADCLARNALRTGSRRVPDAGLRGCFSRLEPLSFAEGFDRIFDVSISPGDAFTATERPAGHPA